MRHQFIQVCILAAIALCGASLGYAADPQSYRVEIASSGERVLDDTLRATSELESLRDSAPVSPFGLIARAQSDIERLKTVLDSFGYYQGAVAITINSRPLDDVTLVDGLSALPEGDNAEVAIGITLGSLYHLRRIDIDGELPPSAREALGLAAGAPAVADDVLGGGARLLSALQDQGYAFAKVDAPIAYEIPDSHELDVSFHVVTGPQVQIGEIRIEGLQRVHESLVRARLLLHTGESYSASRIEQARQDLLGLGVFSANSVQVGTDADALGQVPVTFQLRERLRRAVSINAAYSSDLGGSAGVTWSNRNMFGDAEQLNLSASVINLGGSATTGLGYDISARYLVPDFSRRDQSLQFSVGATKQSLRAYDQTLVSTAATLNRKVSPRWSGSVGVSTAHERIIQQRITRDYTLFALPLRVLYNSTGQASLLADASRGLRASLSVSPTRSFGHPSATFVITQATVAGFLDLQVFGWSSPGRSILAARALAGLAHGASEFSLPPDQRFYGGGSGTVRGYRYQSIGPQFPDGNPIGGTAITAGSVEFRQRFGAHFGAAVFADAGQVSASLTPLAGAISVGVGAGVRYYTPIGPLRLDIAVPTKRRGNGDAMEVYIGLGQAF